MGLIRNRNFWLILAIFLAICVLHYAELLGITGTLYPSFHFGLTRHALDRILFLLPIIYSVFAFGRKGALITSFAALAAMLPRAIIMSPVPIDAILETGFVLTMGVLASWGIWTRAEEKDKTEAALAELQSAHKILQHSVQAVIENEKRQTILNTISTLLGESLELEQILKKAVHMVSELMEVEVALIFSLDAENQELKLVAYEGVSDEFARAIDGIKIGEGVYGEVAKISQPMIVEDASHDPRLTVPEVSEMGIQLQLIVPMVLKDQNRGVLCVAMRRPRKFTLDDMELLTAVGTQIATAMENARLYEKERLAARRLAISERDYRKLFENAHDAIWVLDLQGNITAANESTGKLVGYGVEELKKMNVMRFLSDESLDRAGQIRRKLLLQEPVEQPYEQHLVRKDGTEAILDLTTSLITENGKPIGFQCIARDVTMERRMQDSLRYYLSQITEAQEEERKRIAREFHDDTSQALYALSRQVDNFTRNNLPLASNTAAFLKELRQQLNDTLEGIRRFIQELRPPMLDDLGLLAALRWQVSNLEKQSGIEAGLTVSGTQRRFPAEVELIMFRIVQEALRNVERHAQASKVEVKIKFGKGKTKASICDNGKGFDLEGSLADLPRAGKLGLAGIKERVHLLDGSMKIESEPGKGTRVMIEVPI
jgi:PAS domain S-box-containing protein